MADQYKIFIANVEHMRDLQKEYFRTRNPVTLKEAKAMESWVDKFIRDQKEMEQGQTDLFDGDHMKGGN